MMVGRQCHLFQVLLLLVSGSNIQVPINPSVPGGNVVGDLCGGQGKGLNSVVEHNSNGPWVDALLLRLEASNRPVRWGVSKGIILLMVEILPKQLIA